MSDRPHDMDPSNDPPHDDSIGTARATPRPGEQRGQASAGGDRPAASAAPGPRPGEPSAPDDRGAALDPASEKDLWAGRISWKEAYPLLALWLLLTLGVVIAVGVLQSWQYTWWILAVAGVLLVVMLGRHAWLVLSTHYKLTTQRLFIRRGVFSQTVDQTELLRVDDVKIKQSLIDRMLNIGTIEMISSDRTDTNLLIRDVESPETIAEHIRRHTRLLQRRTLFMEQL